MEFAFGQLAANCVNSTFFEEPSSYISESGAQIPLPDVWAETHSSPASLRTSPLPCCLWYRRSLGAQLPALLQGPACLPASGQGVALMQNAGLAGGAHRSQRMPALRTRARRRQHEGAGCHAAQAAVARMRLGGAVCPANPGAQCPCPLRQMWRVRLRSAGCRGAHEPATCLEPSPCCARGQAPAHALARNYCGRLKPSRLLAVGHCAQAIVSKYLRWKSVSHWKAATPAA